MSWNGVLLRLSRWPRRIAALTCLVLAGVSALESGGAADPARAAPRAGNPVAARLAGGQVAVPLSVASFQASGLVRTGDRVGVLTGPAGSRASLVADGLRVLSVSRTASVDADTTVVVVAVPRSTAARLAPPDGSQVVVVLDRSP